jgi:hypothetical protein
VSSRADSGEVQDQFLDTTFIMRGNERDENRNFAEILRILSLGIPSAPNATHQDVGVDLTEIGSIFRKNHEKTHPLSIINQ